MSGAMEAARASRGEGQPAVWTLKDADTTIYFLGTVHLLRPEQRWRSAEIDAAFARADTIIFEADVTSEASNRAQMQFVATRALDQEGNRLTARLSPEETADLTIAADAVGLPVDALEVMKPWYVALSLEQQSYLKAGYDPASGVEVVLGAEAAAAGKEIVYLESIEEQLGGLASLPETAQIDLLMSTVDSLASPDSALDFMVAEWADGDVAGLSALIRVEGGGSADLVEEVILTARNKRWAEAIEARLNEPGTALVAVGAAHLHGENSLIRMLEARGHKLSGP